MDERLSQFFLAVERMCGDAGLGRLTVRLTLADGGVVTGVPDPLRETEGAAKLDAIGYADAVTVGGALQSDLRPRGSRRFSRVGRTNGWTCGS